MAIIWIGVATYQKSGGSAVRRAAYRSGERLTEQDATRLAAYRSGEKLTDPRSGETHDFTLRDRPLATLIVLPEGADERYRDRATLWSVADSSEPNRHNSRIMREVVYTVPHELPQHEHERIMREVAERSVARNGQAADCSLHGPSRGGDQRHTHVHMCWTTRAVAGGKDGRLGAKTRVFDRPSTARAELDWHRQMIAETTNRALERCGLEQRVDARSIARQADEVREREARGDRAATAKLPSRDQLVNAHALAAWRQEERDRRMDEDPLVWTDATRKMARDKGQREVNAETAGLVAERVETLGRPLLRHEVRRIRKGVEQRRDKAMRAKYPPVVRTDAEIKLATAQARLRDQQARFAKAERVAEIEDQIRSRGHEYRAASGRVAPLMGQIADMAALIARTRAAERASLER